MKRKKGVSYAKYGYIFVIPFVIAYLLFTLYPTIYTCILGFTNCKGLSLTNWKFLEEDVFQNFKAILENETFKNDIKNTVIIWVLNFIPQISLALLLTAWFTSPRCKIRGAGFFKVMFYMPNIITAATVAYLFNMLFSYPVGPVNDILLKAGILDEAYQFTAYKGWGKGIVAFIQFWQWYGQTAIIFIAAVLGINPEIFEAAEIDGASSAQTFFRITLPNIKTMMLYTLITAMIGGLNMYDIPKMFLNGGPDKATETAAVFIYNQAFSGAYQYNRAAAASMLMFVVIVILSTIVFYLMRDKDAVEQKKLERQLQKQLKKSRA
ncbi:MAG: sugar ABC transporter permease [Ruminococcaceae bacterium]|nr:sugar ABC transporter permease [Oscillospiraceae bacterium]